jgi:hypothetical protein
MTLYHLHSQPLSSSVGAVSGALVCRRCHDRLQWCKRRKCFQCSQYAGRPAGYRGAEAHTLTDANIVFTFDEAQQSYNDLNLWLGISRCRVVVMLGQRSVFFHHMEVQLPDQPSIPSEVPQFNLDPHSASLSPSLVLSKRTCLSVLRSRGV